MPTPAQRADIDAMITSAGVESHGVTTAEERRLTALAEDVLGDAGWPADGSVDWDNAVAAFASAVDTADDDADAADEAAGQPPEEDY